ncbi:MAG: HPr family phosphocarrier protein [Alphaproteobacteria bacterium]|nr:HPr family phosphocarrier protein [Alphaproteobacteria bacterium]
MTENPIRRSAEIVNSKGLHARAAAKFCKVSQQFDAEIMVSRNGTEVSGSSIMGLMMLAAAPGTSIDIAASGADAAKALDALCRLVADKFDEE